MQPSTYHTITIERKAARSIAHKTTSVCAYKREKTLSCDKRREETGREEDTFTVEVRGWSYISASSPKADPAVYAATCCESPALTA